MHVYIYVSMYSDVYIYTRQFAAVDTRKWRKESSAWPTSREVHNLYVYAIACVCTYVFLCNFTKVLGYLVISGKHLFLCIILR